MKLKLFFTMVLTALLLTSCTTEASSGIDKDADTPISESETYRVSADSGAETEINLDKITETAVTISETGTYRIRGTLEGMLVIDAPSGNVNLVLDGASITSPTSAAIYVKKAGTVGVTLADGSTNTLANGGEYVNIDANNIDAVIFSKNDLLLDGTGSLEIRANAGHGIVSKDTLVLSGGSYNIASAGHGISAKDSLTVTGGTFVITSGKDGVHAENSDNADLGTVLIQDGTFAITSDGDGISSSGTLRIDSISVRITSGGGAENGEPHTEDDRFGGGRGFFGGWNWNWDRDSDNSAQDQEDTVSAKAIKSGGNMLLNGGTYTVDAADDAIHSNADLTVAGGTYALSTGDDGMHADGTLTVNDGTVAILESYEGIEAAAINIYGGLITLKASDDGFNASSGTSSGGGMFGGFMPGGTGGTGTDASLNIYGGNIFIDADGDGLDSNGTMTVAGGTICIAGPTTSANGAIDYETDGTVTGGTVIAVGAAGMAESFGGSSTQGAIMANTGNQPAGSTVTLTDANGTVLAEYTFNKSFSNVVLSCPGITDSGTYTLTAGTYAETITMDGLLYGSGNGGGRMFGGRMFGGGMDFGGGNRKKIEPPEGNPPEIPNNDFGGEFRGKDGRNGGMGEPPAQP